MSKKPKNEYRSPSYPKAKERRSKKDRRKDGISNAFQPLALAFIKYLETVSEAQEQKIQSELKTAEAISKLADNFSSIKIQKSVLTAQSSMQGQKHKKSDNEHHKQVKQIICKMREKDATYQEIAGYLESNNIPTFTGRGKWHAQTVHRLYEGYADE